jgi:hypothetical protein
MGLVRVNITTNEKAEAETANSKRRRKITPHQNTLPNPSPVHSFIMKGVLVEIELVRGFKQHSDGRAGLQPRFEITQQWRAEQWGDGSKQVVQETW